MVAGTLGPEELATLLAPRDGVIREAGPVADDAGGVWRFGLAEGPVAAYERVVRVEGPGRGAPSGRLEVRQDVRFRVGIPYVAWLFALPLLANLGGLVPGGRAPWWAPPQRMTHAQGVALAGLCGFAVLAGYLGGLLPATATYIGREYHVGDAGQGYALAGVQVGAILALGVLVAADRRGRRWSVIATTVAGALVSLAAAAAPSLATVALTQVAATALLAAQYVLLGVMVVELMPSGGRAWALGLLTMSYGLGGGVTLAVLPLAGLGAGGWRWLYVLAGLAVLGAAGLARHLPETERWRRDTARTAARDTARTAARDTAPVAASDATGTAPPGTAGNAPLDAAGGAVPPGGAGRRRWTPSQRRRLLVLGAGALLFALFATPAAQFQNQYLRVERHWSALHISLAEQVIGTVGALGTLPGGRLADTRGRRPVLALTVGVGTAVTLLGYLTRGPALYGWMTASSLLGYAVTPALAVYGAELFPTGLRGRAGGALNVLAAAGGLAGLTVTGALAGVVGTLGPALAAVAVGPVAVVVLVLVAYPETAGRSLEELNPGDLPVPVDGQDRPGPAPQPTGPPPPPPRRPGVAGRGPHPGPSGG